MRLLESVALVGALVDVEVEIVLCRRSTESVGPCVSWFGASVANIQAAAGRVVLPAWFRTEYEPQG